MYDVESAMRLAAWLMVIIVGIFILERLLRQRRRYHLSNKSRPLVPVKLKGPAGIAALFYCGVIFLVGFVISVVQLIAWAIMTFDKVGFNIFDINLSNGFCCRHIYRTYSFSGGCGRQY